MKKSRKSYELDYKRQIVGEYVSGKTSAEECCAVVIVERGFVVQYPTPAVIRYQCSGNALKHEGSCCVMFGGQRADRLVSEQVLHCLTPLAAEFPRLKTTRFPRLGTTWRSAFYCARRRWSAPNHVDIRSDRPIVLN